MDILQEVINYLKANPTIGYIVLGLIVVLVGVLVYFTFIKKDKKVRLYVGEAVEKLYDRMMREGKTLEEIVDKVTDEAAAKLMKEPTTLRKILASIINNKLVEAYIVKVVRREAEKLINEKNTIL